MNPIQRVAIVGGTHGNEFTGAYLVKKFEQHPNLIQRSSFETLTVFGNPQAFAAATRYIDEDLNRCFLMQDLQNADLSSYEAQRAKAIAQLLGPKGNAQVDVLVDLHSTTANMGLSLLLSARNSASLQLASHLSTINPLVKVCWTHPHPESMLLRSLCEVGIVIEVGPVAQGVLDAQWFQKTEELVHAILDYLEACNRGMTPLMQSPLTLYEFIGTIDYPRNSLGEIQAMVHPLLQGKDYEPLHPGDPVFLTLEGETIPYQGDNTVYPAFINEAAYYEKGIAMCLTQKQLITLENL
ncbi:MAG: aspartoacylase [Leptolyngbyaceae cyanobacterium CRU_2_3]|nr:aspartoacylase [Leptolyngbyaceae cyanobacterium CRU_2_3]